MTVCRQNADYLSKRMASFTQASYMECPANTFADLFAPQASGQKTPRSLLREAALSARVGGPD
jgi:hypothetical protein